jgi:AcrR family transcriptional regulator
VSRAVLSLWYGALVTAASSPGVRARARAELTEQIKAVARQHLADRGAAALSLRAVAREVGMVSSAVYRYFPSRDELLTALIVDAFDAVGQATEVADVGCPSEDVRGRWLAVARAVRGWALANPHEYALVYGSPVPGYAAPTDTVDPAARVSLAFLRLVAHGVAIGTIATDDHLETTRVVRRDLAALRAVAAPEVPDGVLSRAMLVWAHLFGAISYELFGHLHGIVSDYDGFFDLQARRMGDLLVDGLA